MEVNRGAGNRQEKRNRMEKKIPRDIDSTAKHTICHAARIM